MSSSSNYEILTSIIESVSISITNISISINIGARQAADDTRRAIRRAPDASLMMNYSLSLLATDINGRELNS